MEDLHEQKTKCRQTIMAPTSEGKMNSYDKLLMMGDKVVDGTLLMGDVHFALKSCRRLRKTDVDQPVHSRLG